MFGIAVGAIIPFTSCWIILKNKTKKNIKLWSRGGDRRHTIPNVNTCAVMRVIFVRRRPNPSNVGTPSCLPACRLEPWRLLGCLALYRCRDAFSLSRLFSASRLSSAPIPAPKSKRSSKTPRANCPYPEGNVKKCWSGFWEEKHENSTS